MWSSAKWWRARDRPTSIEYIELYNPSTGTVLMGTNLTYATANVWVIDRRRLGECRRSKTATGLHQYHYSRPTASI